MKRVLLLTFVLVLSMLISSSVIADTAVVVPLNKAAAQTNWINLSISGSGLRNGATFETGFGSNSGISLPDTGTPAIDLSFVIPPNFKPGTELSVRLLWHINATSCDVDFRDNYLSLTRHGSTPITASSASAGLDIVGGTVQSADATEANVSQEMIAKITNPVSEDALQPLDSVVFGLYRRASSVSDTCAAAIKVSGIIISYETL